MSRFYFYDETTGILNASCMMIHAQNAKDTAQLNCPAGHKVIAAASNIDALSQRVDIATGEVIDYQPPQPSADHEWNADRKRWTVKPHIEAAQQARTDALVAISRLETQALRAMREALLGQTSAFGRLAILDAQIAELRKNI
jgi:hypothetical protein